MSASECVIADATQRFDRKKTSANQITNNLFFPCQITQWRQPLTATNLTNFNEVLGQWVCSDLFGVLTFRFFTFGASNPRCLVMAAMSQAVMSIPRRSLRPPEDYSLEK